ncbi:MAG: HlyC/CorC family transporter [Bryobacterales bacterium]|nr:HlyC/CorC family transporter [Bryobacterales bacterium]
MDLHLGYRFLLVALIIALNGFFSSAEVALLSVRQSRLRQMADEGVVGAQAAMSLLANPERMLSVVQVGVTLASLGLGWAGEDTVFAALVGLLKPVETPQTAAVLHAVAFTISFLLITYLHVVVGEVVPKNLAIDKSDRLAVLVAPPLLVFSRVAGPFVTVIERSASVLSRAIGLTGESQTATHTPEEIRFIVSAAQKHGFLFEVEEEAIARLLDLRELSAREIMTPRGAIAGMPVEASLDDLLRAFHDKKYSRIPIYERSPEHVVGIIYAKDLLDVWQQRRRANQRRRPAPQFDIGRLLRKPEVVPETKPVLQLIETFRASGRHMALVVDEFGSMTGLVTLEDVLEQVFGEIADEHDVREPEQPDTWDKLELEGTTRLRDLETQYGLELPVDADYETLAGFLLYRLGFIPAAREVIEFSDLRFTVIEMDRNRIDRVKIERIPPETATAGGESSGTSA